MRRTTRRSNAAVGVDKVSPETVSSSVVALSASSLTNPAPCSSKDAPQDVSVVQNDDATSSSPGEKVAGVAPVKPDLLVSNNMRLEDAKQLKSEKIRVAMDTPMLEKVHSQNETHPSSVLTPPPVVSAQVCSVIAPDISSVLPPGFTLLNPVAVDKSVASTSMEVPAFSGNLNLVIDDVSKTGVDISSLSTRPASLNVQTDTFVCKCFGVVEGHVCTDDITVSTTNLLVDSLAANPIADAVTAADTKKAAFVSWANMVSGNRVPDDKVIKLKEDTIGVTRQAVNFDEDLDEDDMQLHSLIGVFPAKFPGREAVHNLVDSWPLKCDYYFHASGWIVFTFEKKDDLDVILLAGPYYAFGKPLLLKKMPEIFDFSNETFTHVPVWVQMPSLPFVFWKEKYLNRICTFLGNPQYTDQATATRKRLSFARCLV